MNVIVFETPNGFGPASRWVYRPDPVAFTMELTTLRTRTWPPGRRLVAARSCTGEIGAAVQNSAGVLLVSGLPPALAKDAATALVTAGAELSGIRGTHSTAAAFSQTWAEVSGGAWAVEQRDTLYRLSELIPPRAVAGTVRVANDSDADLVGAWFGAFAAEAFPNAPAHAPARNWWADMALNGDRVLLWVVDDEPVAMARVHGTLLGMARIGPVYTPAAQRGRGYGAAVTAAAVRYAHRAHARDVVLYADPENPGPNRIYQRLGFVAVGGTVQYAMTA